jgi:hypothetical protein
MFERVIVGLDVVATNLYHTSRVTEVTHEGDGSPEVLVALTKVPDVVTQVDDTVNEVAFAQSSLPGAAAFNLKNKMHVITKRVDGFFMNWILVQQNMK